MSLLHVWFCILSIIDENSWEGRWLIVTWHDSSFHPPRELITQVSGICYTDDGLIVLVTIDGESWMLPGGHPNVNEPIEEAFRREVNEEACAIVTDLVYLGAAEVDDAENPQGLIKNYSVCFWAHVRLNEFRQEYETIGRKMVKLSEINLNLKWHPHKVLDAQLEAAKECEQKFMANRQQQQ